MKKRKKAPKKPAPSPAKRTPTEELQKALDELHAISADTAQLLDKALELNRLNPQLRKQLEEAANTVAQHFHSGHYGPTDLAESQALHKLLRITDQIVGTEPTDANPN